MCFEILILLFSTIIFFCLLLWRHIENRAENGVFERPFVWPIQYHAQGCTAVDLAVVREITAKCVVPRDVCSLLSSASVESQHLSGGCENLVAGTFEFLSASI